MSINPLPCDAGQIGPAFFKDKILQNLFSIKN
jgi:hypothetical protein